MNWHLFSPRTWLGFLSVAVWLSQTASAPHDLDDSSPKDSCQTKGDCSERGFREYLHNDEFTSVLQISMSLHEDRHIAPPAAEPNAAPKAGQNVRTGLRPSYQENVASDVELDEEGGGREVEEDESVSGKEMKLKAWPQTIKGFPLVPVTDPDKLMVVPGQDDKTKNDTNSTTELNKAEVMVKDRHIGTAIGKDMSSNISIVSDESKELGKADNDTENATEAEVVKIEAAKNVAPELIREKTFWMVQSHWPLYMLIVPFFGSGVLFLVYSYFRQDHLDEDPETLHRMRFQGPQSHGLPHFVMWGITLVVATNMGFANFFTIWVIAFVVEHKFGTLQDVTGHYGAFAGALVLVQICAALAAACMTVIFMFAPKAGNSGAPENKGWLNGNIQPGKLFTFRTLIGRATGTVLANTAGFPLGREGPTVTMGSNLAFLVTKWVATPYVRQLVEVDGRGTRAILVDEERLAHAQRIAGTVGGACGMAMLFDSPIGGILYMFEEITAPSWPLETTLRCFAGTMVCALMSRALLNLCGSNTKAFVIYAWSPMQQPWNWNDVPYFVLLAIFLGPFSAFHTRACLWIVKVRGVLCSSTVPKIADAILYAALCATVYSWAASMAMCFDTPPLAQVQSVRYDCPEGRYNPVASMLLTTSEGSLKLLFSRKDFNDLKLENEVLAFVTYTIMNIGLTGMSIPSGNFTGSMLIGGLFGRIVGQLVRNKASQQYVYAPSGVYAMVGAAAMLAGFKQMSMAVCVFIVACANDIDMYPPLMLCVVISLVLNRSINKMGFDEAQILNKKIDFLPHDVPDSMLEETADHILDAIPDGGEATLNENATLIEVEQELERHPDSYEFAIVESNHFGFARRDHLQTAVDVMRESGADDGECVFVQRLAEKPPYIVLEDMAAPRIYTLFAKSGARVVCVVDENGKYKGRITRSGLIAEARRREEEETESAEVAEEVMSPKSPGPRRQSSGGIVFRGT